jgi:hypothetical protein
MVGELGAILQAQLLGHPAVIHASPRRRRVVAEQVRSAMRRSPQPNTST